MTTLGGVQVLGVDSSEAMITEARRILHTQGPTTAKLNLTGGRTLAARVDLAGTNWRRERLDFLVADAQRLPLATGSFDLGLCLNVLDRVADPEQVAHELARILRIGARLVISMPYDWDDQITPRHRWVSDVKRLFDMEQWRCVDEVDGLPFAVRVGHQRRLTLYMTQCLVLERCTA
jgi:SAM-dependent methyltransferase